jgi:NADH:ubiquinone oxidoreductase subunit E
MALLDTHKEDIERHLAKYPDKRSAVMPLLAIARKSTGGGIEEIAGSLTWT